MTIDWITLTSFRVDCILGVLDREQITPQPLDIGIRMGLDLGPAGDEDGLDQTVDYAAVRAQVDMLVGESRFRLLETMGLAICRLLLAPPAFREERGAIARVEVSLQKPVILDGLAVPGVQMARDAAWCELKTRAAGRGVLLDVLHELPRNASYRLHLDAKAAWEAPAHASVMPITGDAIEVHPGSSADPGDAPARLAPGALLRRGAPRRLVNAGRHSACLLVSTAPGRL